MIPGPLRPSRPVFLALSLLVACHRPAADDAAPAPTPPLAGADPDPWSEAPTVPERPAKARFVILGFDGLDPDLVAEFGDRLPALSALAKEGVGTALRTTNPPQSPVAWSTFSTGTLPGKHGVFDFVARDARTYRPIVGTTESWDARWAADGRLVSRAWGRNRRRGTSFWLLASRAGIPVRVIDVPYAWPPDPVPLGGHAAGLGTPDLRLTNSTSTVWSSQWAPGGAPLPDVGGVRTVPLVLHDGVGTARVEGPVGWDGHRAVHEVQLRPVLGAEGAWKLRIEGVGGPIELGLGAWSPFLRFDFPVAPPSHAQGQARFFVLDVGPGRAAVYLDPVGSVPASPYLPLSAPRQLAQELTADAGDWKTVGWEEDTSALNGGLLPDAVFRDEVFRLMDQRTTMALAALDRGVPPLFISVWTAPDRICHMFWRLRDAASPGHAAALALGLGDPIAEVYQKVDHIVAEVRRRLPADTVLLVLSDHGFHGFRRGLHVNTWLKQAGYLVLTPVGAAEGQAFLAGVDWTRTRAYALGTGQIYLNQRGREGHGVVLPTETRALAEEIAQGLRALQDEAGQPILRDVALGDLISAGPARSLAPDLQLLMEPGWQVSWETRLGGVPTQLFSVNDKRWSGDHSASDPAQTMGVLLANRPLQEPGPGIEDIAPTVLLGLGVPLPEGLDGHMILRP